MIKRVKGEVRRRLMWSKYMRNLKETIFLKSSTTYKDYMQIKTSTRKVFKSTGDRVCDRIPGKEDNRDKG